MNKETKHSRNFDWKADEFPVNSWVAFPPESYQQSAFINHGPVHMQRRVE
jgi:hypothetical protein